MMRVNSDIFCRGGKITLPEIFERKSNYVDSYRDLTHFFGEGLKKLVYGWDKCIQLNGDYVEKLHNIHIDEN